jgi:hypothetical protein
LLAYLHFIQLLLLVALQVLSVHERLLNGRVLPLRCETVRAAAHLAHHALLELPEILRIEQLCILKSYL